MDITLDARFEKLRDILRRMGSVVIAHSGGVDSSFLAKVAFETLGEKSLAIIATSETYPERELDDAIITAKTIGINHLVIHSEELANTDFAKKPQDS